MSLTISSQPVSESGQSTSTFSACILPFSEKSVPVDLSSRPANRLAPSTFLCFSFPSSLGTPPSPYQLLALEKVIPLGRHQS